MYTIFEEAIIKKMIKFFDDNYNTPKPKRMVCIVTLNHGIKMLYNDMKLKLGTDIAATMSKLEEAGKVADKKIIEFLDKSGKKTTGVVEPETLSSSVEEAISNFTGSNIGWLVITLSIMDGYHSVTLLVNKSPQFIEIYWCDQNDGCKKLAKGELDSLISQKTKKWWNGFYENKGVQSKSRTTIWLLKN